MGKALNWIFDQSWAITELALQTIIQICDRDRTDLIAITKGQKDLDIDTTALSAKMGAPLIGTSRVEIRDGVAIIPITGPIFPRANIMTQVSGATSIQLVAHDFTKALEDGTVNAILFDVDSPGGEITGISEFAQMVYEGRKKKPIETYIRGVGASAAYWIASATSRITIGDTAKLGSIGVITAIQDNRAKNEKEGTKSIEIVSSISPYKGLDLGSNDSIARVQTIVDQLAGVMVQNIAQYRGTDEQTVLEDFGKGNILVGAMAYGAGLADEIGSFESVLKRLSQTKKPEGGSMDLNEFKTEHNALYEQVLALGRTAAEADLPEKIEAARNEGATKESGRIAAIQAVAVPGVEEIVAKAIADPKITVEAVSVQILQHLKKNGKQNAISADAQSLAAQTRGIGASQVDQSTQGDQKEDSHKEAASAITAGLNAKTK